MKHSILTTLAALAVLAFTTLPLSAAEVVTYYHNDHLGSPIAATDDTGTVVWQQAYDAWGLKLTANTDERGYTGNWLDEETGLADHKARWYTSSIGRFTGIDPVEWHETNIHSFNRYAYGNNNPYSYADQNGELAFPVVPILGVMALEALGVGLEVATMEETSDSINRSGAGAFGVTGVKLLGSPMKMGLKGANVTKGAGKASDKAPDFVVSPGGTAFPVPKGATGPTPVVNPGGKTTGSAFTGGKGGANGKADTMRIMNPTPSRGKSPGYPNGYIKYENKSGQGVDPYTGRTLSNKDSHFPID